MNDPLKKYRRQFRIWKNDRKLKREQQVYAAEFQRKRLTIPDDDALHRDLKNVFPHLVSKPKGQLKIIAIYHHYNWENYSLKPALEKFGQVRHYDWYPSFNHQDRDWRRSGIARMNRALEEIVRQWMTADPADVIFMYVSGELIEPSTLAALRVFGIPLVNLALNDKEHFVGKIRSGRSFGARDICRYFDLSWTSTEDSLIKYRVEGGRPIYMPEGANPEIHKPYEIEKTIDVSFVGQCYGNREAVVDELVSRGIKIEAYGMGWPRGPLSVDDMVKLYSRSRINLGFSGVAGHKETFCLKGRDFEIPMSGGLYLTEHHPEITHAFEPGKEILTYSDSNDLVRTIHYYLQHPEEAQAIREQGRNRSLRDHTWESRFTRIFRVLGLLA